ncbi:MAG: AAA family ATPase [Lachnospiraceae bacterium]|nr:AAA family ATPase [Lachnospiraceae bacterium]
MQSKYTDIYSEIRAWINRVPFKDFYNYLSEWIIGQDNLRLIAANVYNYLDSIANHRQINHNVLLTAPSGTGKTETYRVLKAYFEEYIPALPIYIRDTSAVTATGFKGTEVSQLLVPLVATGYYKPYGLVFLDEFDKKILPSFNSGGDNVNMEAQYAMLTVVEGSDIEVKYNNRIKTVNTENVMFIGLGSFDYFRKNKEKERKSIGFGSSIETFNHFNEITRENMIEAGGCYELIGRFPLIINYNKLSSEAIDSIIYKNLGRLEDKYDCDIKITKELQEELHEVANSKFGCRLIDSVISQKIMEEYSKALCDDNPDLDKHLVIRLDTDDSSYSYRDLTEEEKEENDPYALVEKLLASSKSSESA